MMLAPHDNNFEFAYNCVRWLRGQDPPRGKVLFVEEGQVRGDLNVPLRNIPLPLAEIARLAFERRNELLAGAEQALVELEERDAFNRGLLDWLEDQGVSPLMLERAFLLAGTLVLLLYGSYLVTARARHRREPTLPALAQAVAEHARSHSQPVLAQRHQALVRGGNLWEAARELARQCFASPGLARGHTDPGRPPRVQVRGGWWQRRLRHRQVLELWRLAHGTRPVRIRPAAFRRLAREAEELRAALADGSVRLTSEGVGNRE
jgi:hypothetical protein